MYQSIAGCCPCEQVCPLSDHNQGKLSKYYAHINIIIDRRYVWCITHTQHSKSNLCNTMSFYCLAFTTYHFSQYQAQESSLQLMSDSSKDTNSEPVWISSCMQESVSHCMNIVSINQSVIVCVCVVQHLNACTDFKHELHWIAHLLPIEHTRVNTMFLPVWRLYSPLNAFFFYQQMSLRFSVNQSENLFHVVNSRAKARRKWSLTFKDIADLQLVGKLI